MRVLALTDIHGRISKAKKILASVGEVDAVIVAGDITHFEPWKKAVEILEILRKSSDAMVLFIPGNCDDPELLNYEDEDNEIINIHGKSYGLNNYIVFGIGGSNPTPFGTPIEFSEEKISEILDKFEEDISRRNIIMVTHAPINGINDKIMGVHVGSRILRDFLEKYSDKISLWITGHLHEYRYATNYNDAIIINPGPAMRGYYGLIEISHERVKAYLGGI